MKATELRIGNYITYPKYWKDKPIRVTGISVIDRRDDHSGIYEEFLHLLENDFLTSENFDSYIDYKQGVINPLNAQPIELTEELVKKLGFKLVWAGQGDGFVYGYGELCNAITIHSRNRNTFLYSTFNSCEKQIKYVHELQNLFFALTGEELKNEL